MNAGWTYYNDKSKPLDFFYEKQLNWSLSLPCLSICIYLSKSLSSESQAFVTLATTYAYCMGSLVVGKSLRRHGTSKKLVVMVSPNVPKDARWEWPPNQPK